MTTTPREADPIEAANNASDPPVIMMPTPEQEMKRVQQFPAKLKTTVRWVRAFLHGGNQAAPRSGKLTG